MHFLLDFFAITYIFLDLLLYQVLKINIETENLLYQQKTVLRTDLSAVLTDKSVITTDLVSYMNILKS
jgi:hypothetical protein